MRRSAHRMRGVESDPSAPRNPRVDPRVRRGERGLIAPQAYVAAHVAGGHTHRSCHGDEQEDEVLAYYRTQRNHVDDGAANVCHLLGEGELAAAGGRQLVEGVL